MQICFISALSSEVYPVYKVQLQDSHAEMQFKWLIVISFGLVLAVASGSELSWLVNL